MNATWRRHYDVDVSRPWCDLLQYERPLLDRGEIVVGIDEVGRGALAGPLTVGVVALTRDTPPPDGLTDSKLLSAARREALIQPLREWASEWSLGSVSAAEIDRWGMRVSLAVAATRAIGGLATPPTFALIDGSFNLLAAPLDVGFDLDAPPEFCYASMPQRSIVKGDRVSAAIAAASVLAKVDRDQVMTQLHETHPEYGWSRNKGYGTEQHMTTLRQRGPSPYHRQTWRLPTPDFA
jgi:ribonuclease HII